MCWHQVNPHLANSAERNDKVSLKNRIGHNVLLFFMIKVYNVGVFIACKYL